MSNNKSLCIGLLFGGLIGGVAALLATPTSGRELREQIKTNCQKLDDTISHLKTESISLKDQMIKTAKDSVDVIKEVSSDLQKSIKQWQHEIEPHKENLQNELKEIEEKIKQLEQVIQK